MQTFGERLKAEREGRGLSIEAVSETVQLDPERLQALESNDFAKLPDEGLMTGFLEAYAACLQVDAELMIEDYDRERQKCLRRLADALPDPPVEVAPAPVAGSAIRHSAFPRSVVVLAILVAVVVIAAWWMLPRGRNTSPSAASNPTASRAEAPPSVRSAIAGQQAAAPPIAAAPTPSNPPPDVSGALSIHEHGIGTGVENRALVGRGTRFAEGTEVWFWTHVTGGSGGDRIEHVWLHEGVERTRVTLRVGSSSWRTQSAKVLRAGSVGAWTVEARDATGRVLERVEFACVP